MTAAYVFHSTAEAKAYVAANPASHGELFFIPAHRVLAVSVVKGLSPAELYCVSANVGPMAEPISTGMNLVQLRAAAGDEVMDLAKVFLTSSSWASR